MRKLLYSHSTGRRAPVEPNCLCGGGSHPIRSSSVFGKIERKLDNWQRFRLRRDVLTSRQTPSTARTAR